VADDTSTADTTAADDTGAAGDAGERTFTQAELDRIAGRERAQGKRAAEQAFAADLGMSVEEVKAALKAKNDADLAAMSEADRKLAEANDLVKTATAREAAAAARDRSADIRAALADADVPSKVAGRLLSLVDAELGGNPADADHIAAAIEAVKTDLPALFAPAADPQTQVRPPNGDPRGKPPAGGQATVTAIQRGADRAARMGLAKPANQSA
jgi:DNA-binding transcriptional MerR regulator